LARLGSVPRVVLAVSGGRDSMVLLDAVARVCATRVACVATFDHGTGSAATEAAILVERAATDCGFRTVRARARGTQASEAGWRGERWEFLARAAAQFDAPVATAHTLDDQVETVFMRALRGSGPRGLAGLYAHSDIVRPLLAVRRAEVADYARRHGIAFVEDPSNLSRRFLRNRVRLDLLPALERAQPGFSDALLAIAQRAAQWRKDVEDLVDSIGLRLERDRVFVPTETLPDCAADGFAHLWQAIAARAGITLDRRGTARLAAFSTVKREAGPIQLAGGHVVIRHRRLFELRRGPSARHWSRVSDTSP
jgi:tRNA(Ile)-lysidine synthase